MNKTPCSSSREPQLSNDTRMVLVCFAVKEEAAPFKKIVRKNPAVRVLVTGMGKRNTENAVRAFLEYQVPKLVLTCGFSGGLDPALTSGTVVYQEYSAPHLADKLEQLGAKRVRFLCESRIAITQEEKRALREKTGADAVEMESECISAFCRKRNIPNAAIRTISDAADEELPLDFNALMTPEQEISYTRLALALARSPQKIPHILALRKRTTVAAENLARVLHGLLHALNQG